MCSRRRSQASPGVSSFWVGASPGRADEAILDGSTRAAGTRRRSVTPKGSRGAPWTCGGANLVGRADEEAAGPRGIGVEFHFRVALSTCGPRAWMKREPVLPELLGNPPCRWLCYPSCLHPRTTIVTPAGKASRLPTWVLGGRDRNSRTTSCTRLRRCPTASRRSPRQRRADGGH